MDNELEKRFGRLEAGQARWGEQLDRLLEDQTRMLQVLYEVRALMTEPDEGGKKLHDALAQLSATLSDNDHREEPGAGVSPAVRLLRCGHPTPDTRAVSRERR